MLSKEECEDALNTLLEEMFVDEFYHNHSLIEWGKDTLKQLIDEHFELKEKVVELESSLETQGIVIIAYEDDFKEYKWEIEQLEKALDKACIVLESYSISRMLGYDDFRVGQKQIIEENHTKEEWKEWALHEQ